MPEALNGLRIVEASAFIAAPLAGLQLAQMGADVIRIDPITGGLDQGRWPVTKDGKSLYWAGLNKGKRSVLIDTRKPEGQELATRIISSPGDDAGILLTNLQAKGWLAYEALKQHREDLVMMHIVGNRDGSVALDYTVNAAAGFPFVTGPENHDGPVNHVLPVWDIVAAFAAVNGLLVAERHRRATGEGQYVCEALSDTAFSMLSHLGLIGEVQVNNDERPRLGNHVYGSFAHDFETKDNRRVMVTAFTPRHWQALVSATGTQEQVESLEQGGGYDLNREEDRFDARRDIEKIFTPKFRAMTFQEACAALEHAGACWGPYQTFSQAVTEDERISEANPMFSTIDQPGIGAMLSAGALADFSALPRQPAKPAPLFGEHTEEVLSDVAGLDSTEIGKLFDAGIVAGQK
ncbi:MAG: CoA transferase [Rhodospirillales bacterium]|jgi:2-methylfumaryl-CoA isomerase